jgi:hypothetical protein
MAADASPKITDMSASPTQKSNEEIHKELREILNRLVGAIP